MSSKIVQVTHLQELVEVQENFLFKLVLKLNNDDPTNFNKMKMSLAINMLNRNVSSSLNF